MHVVAWGAVALLMGAIAWTFTKPPPDPIEDLNWADPIFHFAGFFALTILLLVAARPRPPYRAGVVLGAVLVGFSAGVGVELLQTFSPVHTADLADVAVNGVGGLTAAVVWVAIGLGRRLLPLFTYKCLEPLVKSGVKMGVDGEGPVRARPNG